MATCLFPNLTVQSLNLIEQTWYSTFGLEFQIQYSIIEATRNSINEIDLVECKPTKKHYPNPPSLSDSLSIVNLVIAEEKLFLRKRSGAKRKKKHQRTSFVHNCPRKRSLSSCSLASVVYSYTAHKTGPAELGDICSPHLFFWQISYRLIITRSP